MSADGSKYVVDTGEGYETIVSVSQRKAVIMLGSIDAVDWAAGTSVYACADREGIRLATAEVGERIAGPYSTHEPNSGGVAVGIAEAVVDYLDVPDGGDVRVYGHDDSGLLLVNADDDPRIATDGGLGVSDAGPDQNPPGDAMKTDGGSHLVKACPECNSSDIRTNTPGSIHGTESGGRWYCSTCKQYFDEPVERESQGRSNTPAAGEETLKAMDPDELLTDGGTDLPELTFDDRLRDEDNDDEDAFVRVVEHHTDERADEFPVYETDDGTVETVYDYHRGRVDPDDSVVDVVYEESLVDAFGADIVPATRDADAASISNDERRRRLLHFLQDYALDSFVANDRKVTVYSFPRSRLTPVAHAGDGDPGGDDHPRPDGGVAAADFMTDGGVETTGERDILLTRALDAFYGGERR